MITPEEIENEKQYLEKVCEVLTEEIESYNTKVKALSNNIQEQMSYAWDKTNRLSDTEFVYALANIQKRSVYAENANKKVTSYRKMLNNAYFARIDFDDGEEGLRTKELLEMANASSAGNRIIILDCCHAGDIANGKQEQSGPPPIKSGTTILATHLSPFTQNDFFKNQERIISVEELKTYYL